MSSNTEDLAQMMASSSGMVKAMDAISRKSTQISSEQSTPA